MNIEVDTWEEIEEKFGFKWNDPTLLLEALTHTSFANDYRGEQLESNQRLEFLGDAVLELIVSEYLFKKYPRYPEGLLTKIRSAVVCEPTLVKFSRQLDLGNCLLMGRGEEISGGRERPSILADAFEALIGAIYLDQGYAFVRDFALEFLVPMIEEADEKGGQFGDYKTRLQETVQKKAMGNFLTYPILNEEGPDHDKRFTAGVAYKNILWGKGIGKSKKEAEQMAAKDALEKLEAGLINFSGDEDE